MKNYKMNQTITDNMLSNIVDDYNIQCLRPLNDITNIKVAKGFAWLYSVYE